MILMNASMKVKSRMEVLKSTVAVGLRAMLAVRRFNEETIDGMNALPNEDEQVGQWKHCLNSVTEMAKALQSAAEEMAELATSGPKV